MSKKETKKNNNMEIGGDLAERLVGLFEREVERHEDEDTAKDELREHVYAFVNDELRKVEQRMKKLDNLSEEYYKCASAYDKLISIVRYW